MASMITIASKVPERVEPYRDGTATVFSCGCECGWLSSYVCKTHRAPRALLRELLRAARILWPAPDANLIRDDYGNELEVEVLIDEDTLHIPSRRYQAQVIIPWRVNQWVITDGRNGTEAAERLRPILRRKLLRARADIDRALRGLGTEP